MITVYYPRQIHSSRMAFLCHWMEAHPLSPAGIHIKCIAKEIAYFEVCSEAKVTVFACVGHALLDRINSLEGLMIDRNDRGFYRLYKTNEATVLDPFDLWFLLLSAYAEQKFQDHFLDDEGLYQDEAHVCVRSQVEAIAICDQNLKQFWTCLGLTPLTVDRSFCITHDVDYPNQYPSMYRVIRPAIGAITRKEGLKSSFNHLSTGLQVLRRKKIDPYDTFEDLLIEQQCQKIIYFLVGKLTKQDGFKRDEKRIKALATLAQQRGYEIGIHPSFRSAQEASLILEEWQELQEILHLNITHFRQHFLRFKWSNIWKQWNQIETIHDGSIGFRHHLGFRLGTSFPFFLYNLFEEKMSHVKTLPMAYMDNAAYRQAQRAQRSIYELTATFLRDHDKDCHLNILVHNSSFVSKAYGGCMDWDTYKLLTNEI